MDPNVLYYGDNLKVLPLHVKDEAIDLIYLDPPFKSTQNYNVLFREQDGSRAAAQIKAFEDTWEWDQAAVASYQAVVEAGGRVADALQAFRKLMPGSDMLAYLSMMAPRLVELKRVLKPTGSIYLHCDPTASHYLKILMDAVFGPLSFRNEIIWRRTGAHSKTTRYGPIHDTILFYTKTGTYKWRYPTRPFMKGHVEQYFVKDAKGWRTNYYGNVLTGSGRRNGESGQPWQGFDPTAKGRHWAIPGDLLDEIHEDLSSLTQHQKLDRLLKLGFIKIVPGQAWPIYEHYIQPGDGTPVPDIWAFQPYTGGTVFGTDDGIDEDVRWLSPQDKERLGYPTQKPVALLERIIQASSDEGDLVLDPFCGCGTTIDAAQRLKRHWIGIDITQAAIVVIKQRLAHTFGSAATYTVVGEPESLPDAEALAAQDPYQFQWWILGLVGARPTEANQKKGKDKGIDGRLYFHDEPPGGKTKQIIFSVKAGHATAAHLRDLIGVLTREDAQIGVLLTLQKPTKDMRKEAADAGFYTSHWGKHPRVQVLTVEDLLAGKRIDYPPAAQVNVTFKKATKAQGTIVIKLALPMATNGDSTPNPAEKAQTPEE